MPKVNLSQPFAVIHDYQPEDQDYTTSVTLAPRLATYSAKLEYDARGNANLTICDSNGEAVFDFCLDNGEINVDELTN